MRLAAICVGQETNDFNPRPTTLDDFRSFGIDEGPGMMESLRTVGQIGGFIQAVEASSHAITPFPIIRAWCTAGGRITTEARRFFEARMRDGLKTALPLDGLALELHGACAAVDDDDVEGAQIALCREVLGPDVPIVLSLDHHASVTRRMVENATAIVAHRTQPHDVVYTGRVGAELLIRIVAGEVRPVIAYRHLRLLSHQEQFLTAKGPMKTLFDRAREMEKDPRVLQACPFPMQPWLDVEEGGWTMTVTTDGDPDLASRLADELADLAWSMRALFQRKDSIPVDRAVREADESTGLVMLSDVGDTVFGGAAGDSNVILESILRQGIRRTALVPMIAPKAVATLAAAGEGALVTLPLGGEATSFFRPLEVTGKVRRLGGGKVRVEKAQQQEVDMGQVAVFETGPVTMLITELRGVAGNEPGAWRAFGVEPTEHGMVVLKTVGNFRYFAPIASRLILVDTPGPGQSEIKDLPWKRIPRPIYPLDDLASWRG
jgi:microcystin degradation protein MlrC